MCDTRRDMGNFIYLFIPACRPQIQRVMDVNDGKDIIITTSKSSDFVPEAPLGFPWNEAGEA